MTGEKNRSKGKVGQQSPGQAGGKKLLRMELVSPLLGPGEGTPRATTTRARAPHLGAATGTACPISPQRAPSLLFHLIHPRFHGLALGQLWPGLIPARSSCCEAGSVLRACSRGEGVGAAHGRAPSPVLFLLVPFPSTCHRRGGHKAVHHGTVQAGTPLTTQCSSVPPRSLCARNTIWEPGADRVLLRTERATGSLVHPQPSVPSPLHQL